MSAAPRAGARVLVMGLGSFGGGEGAARHLARAGCRVTVTDVRTAAELVPALERLTGLGIETRLGGHDARDFVESDLVVVNPAVRLDHPLLESARRAGVRVTSEVELFLESTAARVVAVTGTQGKSSTCSMLHQLLAATGAPAHLGGNIGGSLLEAAARFGPEDVVVAELSSYQLEALGDPVPAGARVEAVAITNCLEDHLERHGDAHAYARAKARILELVRPGGTAVVPADDERFFARARDDVRVVRHGGAGAELALAEGAFRLAGEGLGRAEDLRLPGAFQQRNALVALGLARALGAPGSTLAAALGRLRGLPHRLEELGRRQGRRVVDNAVSTTPDSTVAALLSLPPGLLWLGGGRLKRLPVDELVSLIGARRDAAVLFGEGAPELAKALARGGIEACQAPTVRAAVRAAFERTAPGDTILFSPAAASFDAYPNFQARALDFRAALPPEDAP